MWSVFQNGEELFKTKSGKLEKCTNPTNCSRHIHPPVTEGKVKAANVAAQLAEESKLQDEAIESLDVTLSVFDNPTNDEMHQHRKRFQRDEGTLKWYDEIEFKPEHEECKSYQTACTRCAENQELRLYKHFTMDEMSHLVRPDSLFAKPNDARIVDISLPSESEPFMVTRPDVIATLHELPESQAWNYLPEKSGMQLELERKGINFKDHFDKENKVCKICNSPELDYYCMDCWTPSGYLIEED